MKQSDEYTVPQKKKKNVRYIVLAAVFLYKHLHCD